MTVASLTRIAACLLTATVAGVFSCAASGAELIDNPIVEEMKKGREGGEETFDHADFEALLEDHVVLEERAVDYSSLADDKEELEAYLEKIAQADMAELGADEQLALLINAYNACTLQLILEHYPDIDSIKDISKPWKKARCKVGSHSLSLDEIEHGLIRPIFKDPRIHFAVNCAAKDCPPLRPFAYTGEAIDEQLEKVTNEVLSSETFARVEDEKLHVTKLFEWYGDDFVDSDFEGHASNRAAYVARYADDPVRAFIEEHDGEPPVRYLGYDWSLNDVDD
ncbi:MAG: DUF547 domain-containing protein [Persicimonas sp.]